MADPTFPTNAFANSGFRNVDVESLFTLSLFYRVPGVAPLAVYGRDLQTDPSTDPDALPGTLVDDEFIRVLPFVPAGDGSKTYMGQYCVRAQGPLPDPPFATSSGGTSMTPGATNPFGKQLASFFGGGNSAALQPVAVVKLSMIVRADPLMSGSHGDPDSDMLQVQLRLAGIAFVRGISLAVLQSNIQQGSASGSSSATPASGPQPRAELDGLPSFVSAFDEQNVAWAPIPDDQRIPGQPQGMMGGLAAIEARVHPSGGDFGTGPDVFVMSTNARWRLIKEIEDRGRDPDFRYCNLTQKTQLHFHGIPVLTGRVRESKAPHPDTHGTTEAWALKLTGPSGIRVLHVGGDGQNFGAQMCKTNVTLSGAAADGEVTNASKGVELYGLYSLVIPEPHSVARLTGIPVEDPFTVSSYTSAPDPE